MLLVVYYLNIGFGYGCIIYFVFGYAPKGDDHVSELLADSYSPQKLVFLYVASVPVRTKVYWALASFGTYFYTCCAVTDAFIVAISQESNEAWLMHRRLGYKHDNSDEITGVTRTMEERAQTRAILRANTFNYNREQSKLQVEERVISDWLMLINDVNLPSAKDMRSARHIEWAPPFAHEEFDISDPTQEDMGPMSEIWDLNC